MNRVTHQKGLYANCTESEHETAMILKDIMVTAFVVLAPVALFSAVHLSTKQPIEPWKLAVAWIAFATGLRIGNTPSLLLFLIPIILNAITK